MTESEKRTEKLLDISEKAIIQLEKEKRELIPRATKAEAERDEWKAKCEKAIEDIKQWKICGTCANYKRKQCPKHEYRDSNYAGCSSWEWRGEEARK